MKRLSRILVLTGVLTCMAGLVLLNKNGILFKEAGRKEKVVKEKESGVARQLESWWQARGYPDPTYLNDKWWAAWEHAQAMKTPETSANPASRLHYGGWSSIGPNNGPGGRILSIAINPSNTNIVFAGSASGGMWKSTDGASNWSYVPMDLPVLGIASILISSANPDVMYAGTGEVYRSDTSNIGFNIWKGRGTYGIGIIKSTDGGTTWNQAFVQSTSNLFGIQKLKFHPSNDNTVFACATDGLYRSTDAGATWDNIAPGKIYVTDVVINSANPDQMLIAVGNMTNSDKGIYRTTNGTSATPTWTKLTTGLPASFNGLVRFGYVSGNTIYAGISHGGTGSELYRSTSSGASWGTGWGSLPGSSFTSFQFWCTNALTAHPTNANVVILGGVGLYRYTVGSGRTNIQGSVHDDIHGIVFDPSNSNTLYIACDGGVYKSTNGGSSFTERNNGLGATQFYASFGVSTTTANRFIGGLQDNGAWIYNGTSWTKASWMGGDGTTCAIQPGNDNIMIACRDARGIYRSANGGVSGGQVAQYWGFAADSRTAFVAPLAFSKSNTSIVYCATDVLHKNTNSGADIGAGWSGENYGGGTPPTTPSNYMEQRHKTGIALAVSPTDENKVYVSTSPFAQYDNDVNDLYVNPPPNVLKSTNGGTSFTSIKNTLPDRFVMDFAISPDDDDSVMVVLGGYGSSHVYLTGDGGATWVDRGTGLPDVPFNAIVFDPNNTNIVYAGSDLGIYVSPNQGVTWFDFNGGLEDAVMIFDLQITADDRIVAATHGKGVFISDLADGNALPVNILDFKGAYKRTHNELKWTVSEERNVSHYELERKIDNGGFVRIANVTARNNAAIQTYSYNDLLPGSTGNVYYYRLKVVDIDGTISYSGIVVIKVTRPGSMEIAGNPVTDMSAIRLNLTSPQKVLFRLYDAKGSLLANTRVDAAAGLNNYSFGMFGMLPSGHYVLEAIAGEERFSKRLVKQ